MRVNLQNQRIILKKNQNPVIGWRRIIKNTKRCIENKEPLGV